MMTSCICPACHEAYIVRCEVIKLEKIMYVCPECEIAWFVKEEIGNITHVYMNDFLLDQGLSASMDEILILEPIKLVGNR